jgi:hypothetical protein
MHHLPNGIRSNRSAGQSAHSARGRPGQKTTTAAQPEDAAADEEGDVEDAAESTDGDRVCIEEDTCAIESDAEDFGSWM